MHLNSSLLKIPQPAEKRVALRLTRAGERAVRAGHPWLFDHAIVDQSHGGRPGDLAVIFDSRRRFLGIGLYDPESTIRVRVLQHGKPAKIGRRWYGDRIAAAMTLRAALPGVGTTGYRLVHGENDGLPGLVIDRYADTYVVKLYTPAWIPHLKDVVPALIEATAPERVVLRLARSLMRQRQWLHGLLDGQALAGTEATGRILFLENGIRFEADVVRGQKTGFFFDQRENRALVEAHAHGRRALNVFAYSGGFSLYAARGGAVEIVSVDISAPALAMAIRNFELNQQHTNIWAAKHVTVARDAFKAMSDLESDGERFDLIIVDPPSFARKRSRVSSALNAYGRLVRSSLALLRPEGMLVISSCSSQVTASAFYERIHREALVIGRPLCEFQRTFHAVDHPITFAEGAYLKCLFAVVP